MEEIPISHKEDGYIKKKTAGRMTVAGSLVITLLLVGGFTGIVMTLGENALPVPLADITSGAEHGLGPGEYGFSSNGTDIEADCGKDECPGLIKSINISVEFPANNSDEDCSASEGSIVDDFTVERDGFGNMWAQARITGGSIATHIWFRPFYRGTDYPAEVTLTLKDLVIPEDVQFLNGWINISDDDGKQVASLSIEDGSPSEDSMTFIIHTATPTKATVYTVHIAYGIWVGINVEDPTVHLVICETFAPAD